jgi:hypothetical protein
MPQEHPRFAAFLQALRQVPDDERLALVAGVLQDPDNAMAQSAVLVHLDRRAGSLMRAAGYMPRARPWPAPSPRARSSACTSGHC